MVFIENAKNKCLIVYNPISGKGIDESVLQQYHKILIDKGYSVDFVATERRQHATEAVVSAGDYEIVFSIGGDGTLNEVVRGNHLRDKKLTICPLPSGTCNDVATMLGYGKNPIDNLNLALEGEVHDMDIGTINDNPFVYVVGMGKFMNIPYETKKENKQKIGYMAYLKEGIAEVIGEVNRYKVEVIVDGVELDGRYSFIMVSNANHIAGINNFYKDVCLDDGEMELLLCKAGDKMDFVKNFLRFLAGKESRDIISLKAHEVSIRLLDKPDKNWCIDGERLECDEEEYHIKVENKMKVLTPKVKTKQLFKCV